MSERNLEMEMDSLKNDLREIKELLLGGKKHSDDKRESEKPLDIDEKIEEEEETETVVTVHTHINSYYKTLTGDDWHDDNPETEELGPMLDRFENICYENMDSGKVSYLGVFANDSSRRKFSWIKHGLRTDELLNLIETRAAEKVLNCIGNNDRLNILLAILKKPMTVAELVSNGGYNSTGQVYHHLKPLIAADLVAEDKNLEKGTYAVQAHKVQGIIMLLAGIHDMFEGSSDDAWIEENSSESTHTETTNSKRGSYILNMLNNL